jgi:NADH:ubiquinone oxidoreductase subunit E
MSDNKQRTIYICEGTGCVSGKSGEIRKALEKEIASLDLKDVKVDFTG